ncbi:MAG: TRAM domain-containing protein, partial [Burkholderiales bacterium]
STFIVGFPGETDREFEELLGFLDEADLDRVGCFAYSAVEGAAANALPAAVPEAVKEERRERFMVTQAAISARRLARKLGSKQRVLIDAVDPTRKLAIGRTSADAPEIDGVVYIEGVTKKQSLAVGDWCDVRIDRADEHDLYGKTIKIGAGHDT